MNDTSVRDRIAEAIRHVIMGAGSMRDKLKSVREQRDGYLPFEITSIMDRAIADLEKSNKLASALHVGGVIPFFTLSDTNGVQWSVKDLLGKGPLVVIFYRGGWCPYCSIQLHSVQAAAPRIEELGATVLAIAPELPMRQNEMKHLHHLTMPLLHDEGNHVARSFGIIDTLPSDLLAVYKALGHELSDVNGALGASALPVPATFVASPNGKIRLAHVRADYADRVSLNEIIEALQG